MTDDLAPPVLLDETRLTLNDQQRAFVIGWKHGTKSYCIGHHLRLESDGTEITLGDMHDSDTVELYCSACITECNGQGWPLDNALIYKEGVTELRSY